MKSTPQQKARYQRWYQKNKEQQKSYERALYARNPEPAKARAKRWSQQNPEKDKAIKHRRRARLMGVECNLTAKDLESIQLASDGICSYCLNSHDSLQVEHCTPLSRGGKHSQENVVMSCPSCNYHKGSKTVLEFMYGI